MSDIKLENAICQAIDILTTKKIGQAPFDKTIRATIVGKSNDGKKLSYRVKGEGTSQMTAYAQDDEIEYFEGNVVYVLIPGNNDRRDKLIVGSSSANPTQYNDTLNTFNVDYVGQDLITKSNQYQLCSYKPLDQKILYPNEQDDFIIDNTLGDSINQAQSILLSVDIRTNFDQTQVGGTYGVEFTLGFKYESDESEEQVKVTKVVTVGSDDVFGNPFKITTGQTVKTLFDTAGLGKFTGVEQVRIFIQDFPTDTTKYDINDIIFKNFSLIAVNVPEREELSSYRAVFNFLKTGNKLTEEKDYVIATVDFKERGQKTNVSGTEDKFEYYWFIQDAQVVNGVNGYSKYAGRGWRCLNPQTGTGTYAPLYSSFLFTYLNLDDTENETILDYINHSSALEINSKEINIKCYIIRGQANAVGTDTATIYNSTQFKYNIYIDSSDKLYEENKTVYCLGNGSPTLTCVIIPNSTKYPNLQNGPYKYQWQILDNKKNVFYPESKKDLEGNSLTKNKKEQYLNIYQEILKDQESIVGGEDKATAAQILLKQDIDKYFLSISVSEDVNKYEYIMSYLKGLKEDEYYIDDTLYNVDISAIHVCRTYACGASLELSNNKSVKIGTASLTIENQMTLSDGHQLFLVNGTQVFHYNEDGISPASTMLEKPIQIKPLTFEWITAQGDSISAQQILAEGTGKCYWYLPAKDSFLKFSYNNSEENLDETGNYYIIENVSSITYSIIDNYDNKFKNNNIKLHVDCQNGSLDAYTDFTFAKDGDPGTNGTAYVAKIVSNRDYLTDRVYLTAYNNNSSILYDDLGNEVNNLKFNLYQNSSLKQLDNSKIKWEILTNKISYDTNIKATGQEPVITLKTNTIYNAPYNILRGSYVYNDFTHYAEYPINVVHIANDNGGVTYRVKIAPKTGFKYVTYTSDGRTPQYDNTLPFKVVLEKSIINTNEDNIVCSWQQISQVDGQSVKYSCSSIPDKFFSIESNGNQFTVVPPDNFDGDTLNTALVFKISKQNNNQIAQIHVPIYMNLNRYGIAALNAWDGNSTDVSDGHILSPQIGAGKKDDNNENSFTGIFMGVVKKDENDEDIGLFGYDRGTRVIFLDAETGKAQFGKNNQGKIIIDPRGEAQIYGGNYSEEAKTGMLINLTQPFIKFGSGNFSVTKEGYLTAKGGGNIAGWEISDTALTSPTGLLKLGIDNIEFKNHDNKTAFQVKLGEPVYKEDQQGNTTTEIDHYTSSTANIAGWTFDDKQLLSPKGNLILGNSTVQFKDKDSNTIFKADDSGTVQIGSWIAEKDQLRDSESKIILNPVKSVFKGKTEIGGWTVDSTAITAKNITLDSKGNISTPIIDNTTNSSKSSGWSIKENGEASFYKAYIQEGEIGGITIKNNTISGSGFVLGPSGCHFSGLSITNNGVNVSGGGSYGGSGGGSGISGGGASWTGSGGNSGPYHWNGDGTGSLIASKTKIGEYSFDNYIKNLVVDQLAVTDLFVYQGEVAHWELLPFVVDLEFRNNYIIVHRRNSIVLQTGSHTSSRFDTYGVGPIVGGG